MSSTAEQGEGTDDDALTTHQNSICKAMVLGWLVTRLCGYDDSSFDVLPIVQ